MSAGGPGRKWILPVVLALVIAAIVAGAFFATHPHIFGSSKTATPTPTSTAVPTATSRPTRTPTPVPTATPKPGPTGTPKPGPTGTPRPGPTATPKPAPTPTIHLGKITYSSAQLHTIQSGANAGNPTYTYYLHPFQVVKKDLPKYGFKPGPITIVSPPPPPQPTPTPYTNAQNLPEIKVNVQYQGTSYAILLDQPVQQGPQGVWVITQISAS